MAHWHPMGAAGHFRTTVLNGCPQYVDFPQEHKKASPMSSPLSSFLPKPHHIFPYHSSVNTKHTRLNPNHSARALNCFLHTPVYSTPLSTGIMKRSARQQKAADQTRKKIEERNRKKDQEERRARRAAAVTATAAAAAAAASPESQRILSSTPPPPTTTTQPPPSTPDGSRSEPWLRSSPETPASHSAGSLSQSSSESVKGPLTPPTDHTMPSGSCSAQSLSTSPSPASTTMGIGGTPAAQPSPSEEGEAASNAFLAKQMQNRPEVFVEAAQAKKMKKTQKQRQLRAALPDLRNALPSLEMKHQIEERAKIKKQQKKEKKDEERRRAERERVIAQMAENGTIDLDEIAREQRDATKEAMVGQEIVNVN
ncbi:uncharacterized protein RCC_04586 [Ramularia collo-cygni]|uniref:Uncharacterized protein n=1 Tax=Ramularia collo-cygni TaxID=112498 RepID=A0A2D3UPY2_9PEZI|nr:uncharacterized protein RCC_04586 [Ramularia collo-cygni]CZT18742.1 uncharacterized protein RCC_04586 [Ramularia collo-cygni]